MTEEIDFNKLTVEFVNKNIESFFNTGKDVLKGAADNIRLHLNRSYKDYLSCVIRRYSKAKSFLIRDEPTYLYNFYVPVDVSSSGTKINRASISKLSAVNPFVVITGTGGSGKSMLMRHLLLDVIREQKKVPVLLELRELNDSDNTLIELIQEVLRANHFGLGDEYIEKALKAGHFALLLDGFDELGSDIRSKISKQISKLAKSYDKNLILLSSRPDEEFSRWPLFSVFTIDELSLEQARELVEKLPVESDLKSKFIKDLREKLYKEHKSFLSNPLLLSIMLLTYGQSADIPTKLSIFYSQAYEVLFQRHDALKGAFQRKRSSNLDIQDFGKVFSLFSIQTYDKRRFTMSRIEALDIVEKSRALSGLNFTPNQFLKDAEQAVCLLIEDGLDVSFAHRSFQEYFASRYILNAKPELQAQLVNKYVENMGQDSVINLLHEMNPELLERILIIPELERLTSNLGIKNKVHMSHYCKFFKYIFTGINILQEGSATMPIGELELFHLLQFIHKNYGPPKKAITTYQDNLEFWKAQAEEFGDYIEASSLSSQSKIIQVLANAPGSFSLKYLEELVEIKNRLKQKHENLEASLEELLLG